MMTQPTTISPIKQWEAVEARIKEHMPMIEDVARAITAESRSQHYGIEFDDLRQEGLIAVWLGKSVSNEGMETHVTKAMYKYVSVLGKQRGAARGPADVQPG